MTAAKSRAESEDLGQGKALEGMGRGTGCGPDRRGSIRKRRPAGM
eukprot:CAMPEP_0113329150 /NCGR_PEP_ID=MMETSP0010_2-20120614/20673_1 /TAXON_ID=216773 ORGANISM="Corethron hystrix, Strain 308" /NCGR_SAMPLE_ID=MMETSP0010_2 /ASSEMBLY_ACC=CAM_ASM_000155 /LENGTH=44 /DNA_ID=CAMNT_0000191073 /DNA_START=487 /DNA_END=621 /DNA_ORIENTATION=- /assembly_acc=CAM_ASM_000155